MSNRGYSTAGIAALNSNPEFYQLVKLDFDTPLYLTTCPYDLEYDGQTWLSSAIVSELPTIKESLAMRPNNISIVMDGAALVNQALTFENYNNAEVLIYRYLVATAETVQEYKGFIQTYKKSENKQAGKSTITWSVAGHWFDWDRRYGRIINDQEQQSLHTGDRFFEYFHLTDESINDWAEADPDFGGFLGNLISNVAEHAGEIVVDVIDAADQFLGHFGLGSGDDGDHVTMTRTNVDEHVGNAIDPKSKIKRLPVAYGECRAKGVPIFRSLDPANKEFLYVVSAVSEGTIDGLTGNKVEFKNSEPYNSTRLTSYCTLVAEYDGSQTTADSTLISVFGSSGTGTGYLTSAAHSEDDTVISVDTGTGTVLVGDIVYFGTDTTRMYSVSVALSGGSFTIAGGLSADVANNATVTVRSIWSADHVGNGVAYVVMKYKKSAVWQGEPKPAFVLKGRHIYDPRDGTTAYSANPALITYDLLVNTLYGKSVPTAEIDSASFISAADLAETTNNDHGGEDGGGVTAIDLFSFDGSLITNNPLKANIEKVLFNCRGHITHVAGQYKIICEQTSETSVYSFDEDNIQGDFEVIPTPATAQYNHVLYEIIAPDFDYRPWVEQQKSATYLANDNNKPSVKIFKNIYERNRYRAKNRAATIMKKSREGIRVKLTASNADAMSIECGQIVDLTRDSEGFNNKLFRVTSMTIAKDATCSFNLSEYESTVYDWAVSVEDTPPIDTDLPDPSYIKPPTGLLAVSGSANQVTTDDGAAENRIKVSWTAPADEYVEGYEVQYRAVGDTTWIQLPTQTSIDDVTLFIPKVDEDQDYEVRVRSYNAQGTVSAWVALGAAHTVTGTVAVGRLAQIRGADAYENDSIYWHTFFESLDGFDNTGGTISSSGVTLAQTTSIVQVIKNTNRAVIDGSWAKNRRFKTKINLSVMNNSTADIMVFTGQPDAGTTAQGFGFKFSWNSGTSSIDIYGSSINTSSETKTLAKSIVATSAEIMLEAVFISGTDIEFYIDDVSELTITTNLPSSATSHDVEKALWIKTTNQATSGGILNIGEYKFLQEQ